MGEERTPPANRTAGEDTSEHTQPGPGTPTSQMLDELRDEVRYLREQLHKELERRSAESARYQEIVAALTQANTSLTERLQALEAPRKDHSEPLGVLEPSVDTEPTRTAHAVVMHGLLAPIDKLPWWHYVVGLILIFLTGFTVWPLAIGPATDTYPSFIRFVLIFAILWLPPSIFGFWVGLKQRDPSLRRRIIPFGVLVGAVTVAGVLLNVLLVQHWSVYSPSYLLVWIGGVFIPPWLLYVSGVLIGNAWQRRRTSRVSGTTPTSPIFRTSRASLEPREDWTPRKQAILGWSGTIIAALLSLLGTVITAFSH
jgi:hypothetical protein